ncbi:MAG TPA: membrane dipeptidase [Bacteroidales bacterium]|jgi:membrane dipeptidase|nr:membrane dipeptidase [Bacteroidales bacterium]
MELIIDGHLDLAMNAMEWNRDLTQSVSEIRESEKGMTDKPDRMNNTVSLPEMRKGKVGLCVATQIARYVKAGSTLPGWKSPYQAWAMTQAQLAWYLSMEEQGQMVKVTDSISLDKHLNLWEKNSQNTPVGYVLSLEGADSLVSIDHLERAYCSGLRVIGPAHYGPGTYAQGTNAEGGLPQKGKDLLKEMQKFGIILDVTHLNDQCFWEAIELFAGAVWASHNNCRVFVPHHRQFDDNQIKVLIERNAVIGVAFDAWMLVPEWKRGESTPESTGVNLTHVVQNIDHICQIAGNTKHAAIGSDLDGAFGKEQSPNDINTIADLQKLSGMLESRGYKQSDITNILSGNWIRFLKRAWK